MSKALVLFTAARNGRAITVCHAADIELERLAGSVPGETARDALDLWSLVAIHGAGRSVAPVHALGWRIGLGNTWIASALLVVDTEGAAVGTSSGNAYTLGRPDDESLHPDLRRHLAYSLRTWGFDDVRG